ncbi:MAG: T9SS type A sorting domain-containing protein, partial [Paludibacter sp.]|nr:T9SS type A sorting domain-containing protein [Paludibacter sp.]
IKYSLQNDRLYIRGLSGAETISIYAVTGVCVAHKVMQQENAEFHLPAKGMYIISIEHNGQKERIKVIR